MIWNTETHKTHILGKHTGDVDSIAFSADGSHIASGSSDQLNDDHGKTVQIWDPRFKGTFAEEVHIGWSSVALSHDSQWIVAVSFGHILQAWRLTETMTKTNKLIIKNHVQSLALSHDSSRVVIGCRDGSIHIWNHLTNTMECHWQVSGDYNWVRCVAFSYDGNHIVSASGPKDNALRIWDCHTGNEVVMYRLSLCSEPVLSITFSHDGGLVALRSRDGTWIWNPSMGEMQRGPDNLAGREDSYDSDSEDWAHNPVAFSHDGNHVISGRGDEVWIWNITTNESTMLFERIQLPDGTRVHSLSKGNFHIYDPIDQETTIGIPPYLLSISSDRNWITGEQGEHICWIHPQHRNFFKAHIAESIVCLLSDSGMIVLDLKNTQRDERVIHGCEFRMIHVGVPVSGRPISTHILWKDPPPSFQRSQGFTRIRRYAIEMSEGRWSSGDAGERDLECNCGWEPAKVIL